MKTYIDTQILIACLNPEDAFHKRAKEILGSRKDVVLLESVRKEARETFLRKYNQVQIEILKIANRVRVSNLKTHEEIRKFVEKELKRLINRNPKLENFYKFVFSLVEDLIVDKSRLIEIPKKLSDFAIEIEMSLSRFGEKVILTNLDEEKLKIRNEIYEAIKDIKFEQLRDLEIFCDAVAHSLEEEAEFMTGDRGFTIMHFSLWKDLKKRDTIQRLKSFL